MQPGIDQHRPVAPPAAGGIDRRRRVSILRKLGSLAAGTLILFLLLLYTRDQRQVSRAGEWARRYLESLTAIPVLDGSLPLNLSPPPAKPGQVGVIGVSWLDREQARTLRGYTAPVIVAQTIPISLSLGEDGRWVIVFEAGQWRTEWLALAAFEERMRAQEELIRQRSKSEPRP